MGNWALSTNNAQYVSVDLIGKKNQVILEYMLMFFFQINILDKLKIKAGVR